MTEYNKMKVGDLITTYFKGYFRLERITERGTTAPLFHFVQEYTDNGKPRKSKVMTCDSSWCRPAYENFLIEKDRYNRLLKLIAANI